MLLFVDERGKDHGEAPYEVLAGVAVRERDLWNFIQAIRALEREHFGMTLVEATVEPKGRSLLKRKTVRLANQDAPIESERRTELAKSFLSKGIEAAAAGLAGSGATRAEVTAYNQAKLAFVMRIVETCAAFRVKVFASMIDRAAPRPTGKEMLRKDYAYLFERYFYYLGDTAETGTGIVVFDEIEKIGARLLLSQMSQYFLNTHTGRTRSSRIVPEPFFVHSDLTTAVQIADIAAYCLNWGSRLNRMTEPIRPEMRVYGDGFFNLRYVGTRDDEPQYGITYIDDLRPATERE